MRKRRWYDLGAGRAVMVSVFLFLLAAVFAFAIDELFGHIPVQGEGPSIADALAAPPPPPSAEPARLFQPVSRDTLLFSIPLVTDDTTSLLFNNWANWSEDIRNAVAGPVIMANNTYLFHSKNGYLLYDIRGKLIEEHSLIKDNIAAAAAGKPQTYLAYPFDSETLIYYTDTDPATVFRKRLGRRSLERVPASDMDMFRDIKMSEPLNVYRSGTNEDVVRRSYLMPHLVGFTAASGGSRWWSTDVFFSFASPIILETDGRFASFFPGLKEDRGGNCEVQVKMIEPLGVFSREGRNYYLGIRSETGATDLDEYFQTVILCDQAGNILYCSRLLKQSITDAVFDSGRDYMKRVFTMRKAGRHTFVPAVDAFGDIYYGTIDGKENRIDVFKRSFERFLPSPSAPALGDRFDREGRLSFYPIIIDCSNASRRGIEPEVMYKDDKGAMKVMDREDMMKDSMFVMVHRLPDEDLRRKVARVVPTMPADIGAMQDSIAKLPTTWCPYGISLNHETRGRLSNLDYGFGDIVVCSWVLGVSQSGNVYVRVDLEDWAETVVFSKEGYFIERFTFNNVHYKERKDVVVLDPRTDRIYERDYEAGMSARGRATGYRFVVWKKDIMPIVAADAPSGGGGAQATEPPAKRTRRGR